MFICDRGFHYYVAVCLVLSVFDVFGLGQVGLAADWAPIVEWDD